MEQSAESTTKIQSQKPKRVAERDVFVGKWLKLKHVDYEIRGKVVKNFETIERTTVRSDTGFDAVVAYPIIDHEDQPKQLVVIANYRAPVDKYVLEVPAGLMDCPDLLANALREVKEETGYVADEQAIKLSKETTQLPATFSNAAISGGSAKTLFVRIDPKKEENINPKQDLEDEEDIAVHLVEINENITDSLVELADHHGYIISAGLWSFAQGVSFSMRYLQKK